jgi:hypothetical protein
MGAINCGRPTWVRHTTQCFMFEMHLQIAATMMEYDSKNYILIVVDVFNLKIYAKSMENKQV